MTMDAQDHFAFVEMFQSPSIQGEAPRLIHLFEQLKTVSAQLQAGEIICAILKHGATKGSEIHVIKTAPSPQGRIGFQNLLQMVKYNFVSWLGHVLGRDTLELAVIS